MIHIDVRNSFLVFFCYFLFVFCLSSDVSSADDSERFFYPSVPVFLSLRKYPCSSQNHQPETDQHPGQNEADLRQNIILIFLEKGKDSIYSSRDGCHDAAKRQCSCHKRRIALTGIRKINGNGAKQNGSRTQSGRHITVLCDRLSNIRNFISNFLHGNCPTLLLRL